jgi:hypothetical protein
LDELKFCGQGSINKYKNKIYIIIMNEIPNGWINYDGLQTTTSSDWVDIVDMDISIDTTYTVPLSWVPIVGRFNFTASRGSGGDTTIAFRIVRIEDDVPVEASPGIEVWVDGSNSLENGTVIIRTYSTLGATHTFRPQFRRVSGTSVAHFVRGQFFVQAQQLSGGSVPATGTENQALVKTGDIDYDTRWATIDKDFVGLENVVNANTMPHDSGGGQEIQFRDPTTGLFGSSPKMYWYDALEKLITYDFQVENNAEILNIVDSSYTRSLSGEYRQTFSNKENTPELSIDWQNRLLSSDSTGDVYWKATDKFGLAYGDGENTTKFELSPLTQNQTITVPDASGILALTSDIPAPTQYNQSVTQQGPGFATDTYLTGSSIVIPDGSLRVGTRYYLVFNVTKTAAGTATPIINVRFGTNGSTADASRGTLTHTAGTSAADEGVYELWVTFRSVGPGTEAIVQTLGRFTHRLSVTGLTGSNAVSEPEIATSAGFDSTVSGSTLGVSINGGSSASWTVRLVQAKLENLS